MDLLSMCHIRLLSFSKWGCIISLSSLTLTEGPFGQDRSDTLSNILLILSIAIVNRKGDSRSPSCSPLDLVKNPFKEALMTIEKCGEDMHDPTH